MNSVGRNDPCPCGSKRKFKQCCLARGQLAAAGGAAPVAEALQTALGLQRVGQLREAEAIYRRVLQAAPDHPDALHLLGLMARQEGKHELAVELIGRAARLNPVAPVYFNLGNAYQSLGRLDEAAGSFRQALVLNPRYAAALNNLGIVLQQQGNLEGAIDSFRRALELQPGTAELYSNLGDALRGNQQFDVAIEFIEQAIALKPDFANAHFNLGKVWHDLGESERALASFRQALAFNPEHPETSIEIARTYFSLGQFDTAREHAEHALRLAPDHPEAWAIFAFLKKMTPEDAPWAERAVSLLQGGQKPMDEMQLHYALGKFHDDTRQYAAAFGHYERANCMQRELGERFDRDHHRALVDAIIAAHPAEAMRQRSAGASASARPVFIVGMPRSGTSLMEQILASHPQVFGAGELRFWNQAAADKRSVMSGWCDDAAQIKELVEGYEAELSRHSNDALRVVDKMPANFLNLGLMHAAFPDARIIHMQRNPADTCLSIYFQGFSELHTYANDQEDLAFYYREYRRLMDHWRRVLPPEILLEVPYESLVEDQEGWSRRAIGFIGLEWDDRCLRFHETERRVGTASNWQVRQKIYKTSKARWMNYREYIGPLLPLLEQGAD